MKRIEVVISTEGYTQLEQYCSALGTTPSVFFQRELQGIWGRLRQLYAQLAISATPIDVEVNIVDIEEED